MNAYQKKQVAEREQRLERIRPLAAKSMSATQIAATTGLSRNSVLGLCYRYDVTLKGKVPPKLVEGSRQRRNAPARPRRQRRKAVCPAPDTVPTPKPPTLPSAAVDFDDRPLPGTTPISILDLPNRSGVVCRWPVEGGFCGMPSGEHVYCPVHDARAHHRGVV